MGNIDEEQEESRYKRLEIPEFRSAIPPHLVGKLSEQDRYLVETLSRLEQANHWLIDAVVANNRANIELDRQVRALSKWKTVLTSKWSIVLAIAALCAPVLARIIIEQLLKH